MTAISIDGELVAEERAMISVLDRGVLYGDGVFEVLRTWSGVLVELDAHLDRLYASLAALELRAIDRAVLADAVRRTVAAGDPAEGDQRVRIAITRGPGPLGGRFASLGPGRAIVIAEPLPPQPSEISLAVVDWPLARRHQAAHKTLAYLDHLIARELAAAAGADEAIRLDAEGDVIEGASSNVFVVAGGCVRTPAVDRGALSGITRARVLGCAAELGLDPRVERISVAALRGADELFVTSSLRGVVPVTRLDGAVRPAGAITAKLAIAYTRAMRRQK